MPARSPAHAALGRAVRQLREKEKLTQEQLARASGLQPTYISDIERGVRNPTWSVVVAIADALDVAPSVLVALGEKLDGGG